MKKTMPKLGDVAKALAKDPAIDPPLGDYEVALESFRTDPVLGDPNDCVCFDEDGNALNECDECPR